jgi:uncharacterized protein
MRKRLRKKKHLGEFRQLGFEVTCQLQPNLSSESFDRFIDEFLAEAIEAHGLSFGGGGSPESDWSGVVARTHRYASTTEEHRQLVQIWLRHRPEIRAFELSEPVDLWHGKF